jgi:hypothetical protein
MVTESRRKPLARVLFRNRRLAPLPRIIRCIRVARFVGRARVGSQLSARQVRVLRVFAARAAPARRAAILRLAAAGTVSRQLKVIVRRIALRN